MRKALLVIVLLFASSLTAFYGEETDVSGIEIDMGTTLLLFTVCGPEVETKDGQTVVTVDDWGSSHVIGGPMLPERSYHLRLGSGDHPKVIEVTAEGKNDLLLHGPVLTVPTPFADGHEPGSELSDEHFQEMVRDLGILDDGKVRHWVLRLSPFSVVDNHLFWPDRVTVKVATGSPGALPETEVPSDLPSPSDQGYDAPETRPLWSPAAQELPPNPEAQPSYTNRFPPVECLIITTSTYNSTLKPLADWKTKRGVPTRIIETGWISSRYSGSDTQEKVRNCIISFYNNENLKWVVLGGDHSVVPTRMAYVPDGYDDSGTDGNTVPADSYYGDIAGTGHTPYDWDGDNDGNYGEYSVDGIDLNHEVYVGRLSVSSTTNMQTLVNNILNYEKNPPTGSWYNRAVLAGAYSNYIESTTTNDTTDEATLKDAIRSDFLPSSSYNPYTLYEKGGIWPSQFSCNASLTTSNLISAIDPGAFMVNMAGHGSSTGIYRRIWNGDTNGNKICDSGETTDTVYYSTSASQTNGGKKPLFYNNACNNGEFDRTTCLTEDILLDVGIGAVGSGRVSWYSKPWSKGTDGGYYNQGHDYRFWQQFFTNSHQPGKALALSKYDYILDKTAHDRYCWKNLLQYNLMGDPEIPIWTKNPGTLSISHSPTIPSPGSYTFTVTDGSGNPVNGAKVCLMNLTNFYGTGTTGSDGKCSITLPSITQMMDLTVTARNFKPLTKSVPVGSDTEKPRIVSVENQGAETTGDNFRISALITDNVEVSSAVINFNWSDTQPALTMNNTMIKSGPNNYSFIRNHPSDRVTRFWYRVGARDVKGNWNHSSWYSFAITDNDLPELILDNSLLLATTGDMFFFEVHLMDNVGLGSTFVNYTLVGHPSKNLSMTGPGGMRTASIPIPSNATGTMSFLFYFTDTFGNLNKTSVRYRTIIDDDAPVLISDNSILPPTTGDPFVVNVSVSDNIALQSVRLVHLIGGQSWMNQSMQLGVDGNYTRLVPIPPSVDTNITYRIFATDTSGNVLVTPDRWLDILDNDLPYIILDTSDLLATTGEPFNISVKAGDNIAVDKVMIEWMFEGPEWNTAPAEFDPASGDWYRVVEVPGHATGNLSYRFDLADPTANHFVSEARSIPVMDNDLPELKEDRSDTEAGTGDSFDLVCLVSDNINISSVKVLGGIWDHEFELEMRYSGYSIEEDAHIFRTNWTAPLDAIGELTYRFIMTDTSGNTNTSGTFGLPVTDIVPPVLDDVLNLTYTTGEEFWFYASPEDNIGIMSVQLWIWLPGFLNASVVIMEYDEMMYLIWGNDIWKCKFTMPLNTSGPMRMRYVFNDTSGNEGMFELIAVLHDNDAPELTVLSAPEMLGTGSTGSILFFGTDNIQIRKVNVSILDGGLYVSGTEELENATLKVDIRAASDMVGPGTVLLSVSDGVQWTNVTVTITVYDDDLPKVSIEPIDAQYGLDAVIQVKASVSDNIGLNEVRLAVLSGQTQLSSTVLDVVDGKVFYSYDPTGPMELIFEIVVEDRSGNSVSASVSTVVFDDKAPVVKFKDTGKSNEKGKKVVLDATGTTDTSYNLNYTWKVTAPDGTTIVLYGVKTDFLPDQKGTYKVELTVTDPSGNRATESFDIDVEEKEPFMDPSLLMYIAAALLILLILILVIFFLARSRKKEPAEENGYEEWGEE